MRIDDRKVNGRITIEATDAVQCFVIGVVNGAPAWIEGFDEDSKPITRNSAAVAAQLKILLGDHAGPPVRFSVVESNGASVTVFTSVLYNVSTVTNTLTINLGGMTPNKEISVSLDTGAITIVDTTT